MNLRRTVLLPVSVVLTLLPACAARAALPENQEVDADQALFGVVVSDLLGQEPRLRVDPRPLRPEARVATRAGLTRLEEEPRAHGDASPFVSHAGPWLHARREVLRDLGAPEMDIVALRECPGTRALLPPHQEAKRAEACPTEEVTVIAVSLPRSTRAREGAPPLGPEDRVVTVDVVKAGPAGLTTGLFDYVLRRDATGEWHVVERDLLIVGG